LIPTISLNNVDKLNQEIERIMYFYNEERKQAELGWKTPVEFETELEITNQDLYVRMHDFQGDCSIKCVY